MLAMLGAKKRLRVAARGSGPPYAEVEPSRSPAFPLLISNRADAEREHRHDPPLNGTVATDIDAHDDNAALSAQGYTIRHIETYHRDTDMTCIVWDAPAITEADLPF